MSHYIPEKQKQLQDEDRGNILMSSTDINVAHIHVDIGIHA